MNLLEAENRCKENICWLAELYLFQIQALLWLESVFDIESTWGSLVSLGPVLEIGFSPPTRKF